MKKATLFHAWLNAVWLGLAVAGMGAGSSPARAQNIQLLSWNSQWKYADSGTNLGTIWRTNDYSDADAPWRGPASGLFGFEPDSPGVYTPYGGIPTPLARYVSYPNGSTFCQVTSYYFRATFDWAGGSGTNYYLVASNAVDDGVAVFLNGMPLYALRVTVNGPATTVATGMPAAEGTNEVLSFLPATLLRPGPNLVAAELHQQNATSADAVFGMTLAAVPYIPLAITRQPADLSLSAGENATLDVGVSGSVPWYQWYKVDADGITNLFLQGSDKMSLSFSNASSANSGAYFVVVTNSVSSIVSSSAALTVRTDPLQIIQQPVNVDVLSGVRTNLFVTATGSQPYYRWWKVTYLPTATYITNGTTIVTNISYTQSVINPVSSPNTNMLWLATALNTAVYYFATISNTLGVVTSRVARLRIIEDAFGPLPQSAVVTSERTNTVKIVFDTPLLAVNEPSNPVYDYSARNVLNYTVTTVDSFGNNANPVPVTEVVNVANQVVYLRVGVTWDKQTNYILNINRVADLNGTNSIAPNTSIPIQIERTSAAIPFASDGWRWNGQAMDQEAFDFYVATNWMAFDYNDDPYLPPYGWSEGIAMFWADSYFPSTTYSNCTVAGSLVSQGSPVHYFRKAFAWSTNVAATVTAILNYVVDDGAVFYLNGQEIGRFNMPGGTPAWSTLASSSVFDPMCRALTNTQAGLVLKHGTNVLAVEVHQAGQPDPERDIYFDASLTLSWMRTPQPPAEPTDGVRLLGDFDLANQVVRLSWTNQTHNLSIVGSENLEDPIWYQMQPASTNMVFSLTNQMRFFQLREFK